MSHPFSHLAPNGDAGCLSLKEIGRRFRIMRNLRGLTMKHAARITNRSPSAVSTWEAGTRAMDLITAQQLCHAYGVSMARLFAEDFPGGDLKPLVSQMEAVN